MKKILFATTALVATASVAAADVTISGMARFGVKSVKTDVATATTAAGTVTDITTRMQLDFKASVEADNGMTLAAATRYRSDGTLNGFNAPTISMTSGGFSIVVGNNYGQMYHAPMTASNVGLTGLGYETYVVSAHEYSSQGVGPQGVDVNYTMGAFSVGVSQSKNITVGGVAGNTQTQAGVSYSAGGLSLGVSMQDGKTKAEDATIVAAGYSMDSVSFEVAHGSQDGTKKTRVGASFDVAAATSLTAFVLDTNTAGVKNAYGLGVSHDLGGAKLQAGYVKSNTGSAADFGVSFNF